MGEEVLRLPNDDQPSAEELLADGAMSVNDAAEFCGISRSELYALMGAGQLRFLKLGRRRLIPRRELVRLLANGLQSGQP